MVKGDSSEKIQEFFNSTIDVTLLDAHGQFTFDNKKIISAPLEKELEFIQKEEIADLQTNVGATTPVFLDEEERKRSITLQGKSVNLVSRSVTSDISTNLTVTGLSTGATFNIAVTIKADPSTL